MWRKAWALGKVCVSPEAAASAASSFHLCLYLDPPKQQGSTQGQIQARSLKRKVIPGPAG